MKSLGIKGTELFLRIPMAGSMVSDAVYSRYLQKKADKINGLMSCCGQHASFIFLSDVHWGANRKKSPEMVNYMISHTHVRKVVFGGDFVTHSDPDKHAAIRLGNDFMKKMDFAKGKIYCLTGNHDDNSYEQVNSEAVLTDEEIVNILSGTEYDYPINGQDACNYYFDCEEEKTRYLCLNTAKKHHSDEQIQFIIKALASAPWGWHIVAAAHIWMEWNGSKYVRNAQTEEIIDLLDAYNVRKSWKNTEWKDAGAYIACLVGGHIHNDFCTVTPGGGIPVLLFDCDAAGKTYSCCPPVEGLPSEQCMTAIVLDYMHKKGYAVRIGRGTDVEFRLSL